MLSIIIHRFPSVHTLGRDGTMRPTKHYGPLHLTAARFRWRRHHLRWADDSYAQKFDWSGSNNIKMALANKFWLCEPLHASMTMR